MAYTFEKAQGGHIGNSLCEEDRLETAKELLAKAEEKGVSIHLPSDSLIADKFSNEAETSTAPSNNIPNGWMGLDIGVNACEQFCNVIMDVEKLNYAEASTAFTETNVLLFFRFLNSTTPSASANKVKSFPTPTFLPG